MHRRFPWIPVDPSRATAVATAAMAVAGCTTTPPRFPDDWVGSWRGSLVVPSASGAPQDVVMELVIARTDDPARHAWTIVYDGPAGRQVRAYELVTRDAAAGRYAIDEKNGIVLESSHIDGALYSWFSIAGSNVLVREELVRDAFADDAISVEFVTALDRDTKTTGPAGEARSLVPVSVQRAMLRRQAP
jgi:hypothetical protein